MTDATRGLVRYEPEPDFGVGGSMAPDDSGDWVRYEDAARIQRARVKLFVRCLEMSAKSSFDDHFIARFRGEEIPRLLKRSNRLNRLARYFTAKYLGEWT